MTIYGLYMLMGLMGPNRGQGVKGLRGLGF